jgi:TPR repeat protein
MFDWYGLLVIGLDRQITMEDAVNLLKRSSEKGFTPALVEYGLFYYSGIVKQDLSKAFSLWQKAEKLGSKDAGIRMNAAVILDQLPASDYSKRVDQLLTASGKGSVLAQTAIGFAYENGIGVAIDTAKAVTYYRDSAQRGSRFAYNRLKALYNAIRPADAEFDVDSP